MKIFFLPFTLLLVICAWSCTKTSNSSAPKYSPTIVGPLSFSLTADGALEAISLKTTSSPMKIKDQSFLIHLGSGSSIDRNQALGTETVVHENGIEFIHHFEPKKSLVLSERYHADTEHSAVYKTIEITNQKSQLIDAVDLVRWELKSHKMIQHFNRQPPDLSPWDSNLGRPLFVGDQYFLGVMHPASVNKKLKNQLLLRLDIGSSKSTILLPPVVFGFAKKTGTNNIIKSFQKFLNNVRKAPKRITAWNAYLNGSDYYFKTELSRKPYYSKAEVRKKISNAINRPLAKKVFEHVLVEGGWADPAELMVEDHLSKGRLKYIRNELDRHNFKMGLHVTTHGGRRSVDLDWLRKTYPMSSDRHYCGDDLVAHNLVKKRLLKLVKVYDLKLLKFDWGNFVTNKSQNGACSTYHITEAHIDLLRSLSSRYPDIVLYNTGWYSPWWLLHYDAIFSGGGDYSTSRFAPVTKEENSIQTTYRDAMIFKNVASTNPSFPLSGLMNHAPITEDWNIKDSGGKNKGSLRGFVDMVLMSYMNGALLFENYLNLPELTDAEYSAIGHIVEWIKNSIPVDTKSYMVGKDPFKGQTYGYWHRVSSSKGYVIVRNPTVFPKKISLTFKPDSSVRIRRLYPQSKSWEKNASFRLNDDEVALYEVRSEKESLKDLDVREELSFESSFKNVIGKFSKGEIELNAPEETDVLFVTQMVTYKDQPSVNVEMKSNKGLRPISKAHMQNLSEHGPKNFELDKGWKWFKSTFVGRGKVRIDLQLKRQIKGLKLSVLALQANDDISFLEGLPQFRPKRSMLLFYRKHPKELGF
jgi:hypothetical protein